MHRIFRVKAYEMEHGPHFNEEHARKAVMKMENEDGTRGPHWSIEETTTLASQYGISLTGKYNRYDWYVALNMVYSDYYRVIMNITGSNNTKHYVEFAKAWLNDKDIDEGKMWYYYIYVMCDKIREAEMECYEEELEKHEGLELPNHAFRNRDYVGGFYIDLRTAIPTGTSATLPILIGTNGDTRPLVTYNNEPVRVENLAGTGIYLLHYNKYTNQVFLVSGGYKATATPSA